MINVRNFTQTFVIAAVFSAAILGSAQAWAAGSHGGGHGASSEIGEQGKAGSVDRTIKIKMLDNYYEPESISVKAGETVRFEISNAGDFVHEFNIGTSAMHAAHQKEMMMMMEHGALEPDKINHHKMKMDMGRGKTMEHNDPNSVLLEPGKSGEVIWKFSKSGNIEFACNVPGHYESGMMGRISFK